VVFIVIALSAGRGTLVPASAGALAACLLVAGVGLLCIGRWRGFPKNTLKFVVGVMLSAFGVFGPAKVSAWLAGRRPCDRGICRPVPCCWIRVSRVPASPPHKGLVMNVLIAVLRELIGLFVDDGSLALMSLAVVMLAGILATLMPDLQLAAGAVLLLVASASLLRMWQGRRR